MNIALLVGFQQDNKKAFLKNCFHSYRDSLRSLGGTAEERDTLFQLLFVEL